MLIKAGTQFIATGFVGKDAETKFVGSKNTKCVKFGFKAAEKPVPNGEPESVWVNCSAFGKTADVAESIQKGDIVMVSGTITQTKGADGKDYINYTADFVTIQNEPVTTEAVQSFANAAPVVDLTGGEFEVIGSPETAPF